MRARNLSLKTIGGYVESAGHLITFAADRDADSLAPRTIEEFLASLSDRAPPPVSARCRALQQWCGWLTDEDELPADPMVASRGRAAGRLGRMGLCCWTPSRGDDARCGR